MNKEPQNVKFIYDPLWGLIDVTQFIPMIDTSQFQALGFKYQLGVTNFLFPAATHTRKEHSLGSLKRTQILTDKWLYRGFINHNEARLIQAYALWHDIGHGPFSHVVETVTEELWNKNHDQNGMFVVDMLKKVVENLNMDFEELKKFFAHENPLYLAVHDKNLGAEKLDYLSRDAYYTIGETPGIDYVAQHTYFIDGKLMIDEKAIDNAKSLQDFYVKMFKIVYLRKNSVIAQRVIQKTIYRLIKNEDIKEDEFWAMRDFEILWRLLNSKDNQISGITQKFLNRNLPKSAIALKIDRFADIEKREDKAQIILPIEEEKMNTLALCASLSSPSQLEKLEDGVSKMAGLPNNSVFIIPSNSPERFVPKDINIYAQGGGVAKLSDYFKDHYRSLIEEGKSYITIRICTFKEYRDKLSDIKIAERIKEYLLSLD